MARQSVYINNAFLEMQRVRQALRLLFPGYEFPEYDVRSRHGQEFVNASNWHKVAEHLVDLINKTGVVETQEFYNMSDEMLQGKSRAILTRYVKEYAPEKYDATLNKTELFGILDEVRKSYHAGQEPDEPEFVDPETGEPGNLDEFETGNLVEPDSVDPETGESNTVEPEAVETE